MSLLQIFSHRNNQRQIVAPTLERLLFSAAFLLRALRMVLLWITARRSQQYAHCPTRRDLISRIKQAADSLGDPGDILQALTKSILVFFFPDSRVLVQLSSCLFPEGWTQPWAELRLPQLPLPKRWANRELAAICCSGPARMLLLGELRAGGSS